MAIYPDTYWQVAYEKALRVAGNGPVLVPEAFGEAGVTPYSQISSTTDYEVIVAHKDALLSFPRWLVARLAEYETVLENSVFFVLRRPRTEGRFQLATSVAQAHMTEIMHRVSGLSAQLDFVHIPKTAGTSITQVLRSKSIGYQYFSTHQELTACTDINVYSTVAGHFYLSKLLEKRGSNAGDVFTVIRNPVDRFLSAVGHARRAEENPESFGPSMKAMRTMSLPEFMDTKFAGVEIAQTSWMLGHPSRDGSTLEERFSLAEDYVRSGQIKIFDQSNLAPLTEYLRQTRNHVGGLSTLNRTQNKANAFTIEEQAFCGSNEFKAHFRDEISFYNMLCSMSEN
ncbi:sulfotransferase family 2 domain-containing protein [Marivita geojedonensis]|uniref:Sulfotransferase domain-containing protein n=1 Tax=Marivita geojedonensis TaxID=1123756 RepID=A0A1X4NEI1_9RHOB|nr:sulfotransferase family 2 domain-containing protein [Marivita geojedonensis]OSQ45266.1 hypothetical protein MGEO_18260 [Marivita geojedonensis]PRY73889.1 sulfotransferase family protein [Marivita geojedonensis]